MISPFQESRTGTCAWSNTQGIARPVKSNRYRVSFFVSLLLQVCADPCKAFLLCQRSKFHDVALDVVE